jgi:acetyl esterase
MILPLALALLTPQPAKVAPEGCGVTKPQVEIAGATPYVYRTVGGAPLKLWMVAPPAPRKPAPAILFFFGGGWRNGSLNQFESQARYFRDRGYVTMLADYRVYCRHRTLPADAVADGAAAIAWVRDNAPRLGVRPHQIVAGGGSAGGHVALASAAYIRRPASRADALLLFNEPVDLTRPEVLRYTPTLTNAERAAISPKLLPKRGLPPMAVFQGSADTIVLPATNERYCADVREEGGRCDFHLYAGAEHGFFNKARASDVEGRSFHDLTSEEALRFLADLSIVPDQ